MCLCLCACFRPGKFGFFICTKKGQTEAEWWRESGVGVGVWCSCLLSRRQHADICLLNTRVTDDSPRAGRHGGWWCEGRCGCHRGNTEVNAGHG